MRPLSTELSWGYDSPMAVPASLEFIEAAAPTVLGAGWENLTWETVGEGDLTKNFCHFFHNFLSQRESKEKSAKTLGSFPLQTCKLVLLISFNS
jgi:hypothetical protein